MRADQRRRRLGSRTHRRRVVDPQLRKKGGKSGSYDDWKVEDLRKRAKELGMSGYSGRRVRTGIDAA